MHNRIGVKKYLVKAKLAVGGKQVGGVVSCVWEVRVNPSSPLGTRSTLRSCGFRGSKEGGWRRGKGYMDLYIDLYIYVSIHMHIFTPTPHMRSAQACIASGRTRTSPYVGSTRESL